MLSYSKHNNLVRVPFKKGSINDQTAFSKHTFFRKLSNSMDKINAYASPTLTTGSIFLPELAPFDFGLNALTGLAHVAKGYEDSRNKQMLFDGQLTKRSRQGSALEKKE